MNLTLPFALSVALTAIDTTLAFALTLMSVPQASPAPREVVLFTPVRLSKNGAGGTITHPPSEHDWLSGHFMPQPPQLLESVLVETSQPFAWLPSQSANPGLH